MSKTPMEKKIYANDKALQALRAAYVDPMWAEHSEVPKQVLLDACVRIQKLTEFALFAIQQAHNAGATLDIRSQAEYELLLVTNRFEDVFGSI